MALNLDDIHSLFEQFGGHLYSGEPVTQLEHALQCGALAEADGAGDSLVCAAFLHDLGHLLNKYSESPAGEDADDLHQYFSLPFLRPVLPDAVLEPIRLHVDAKRCLCTIDHDYYGRLTPGSVQSLQKQGGAFSPVEAQAFLQRPFAQESIRLRRWDDCAKEAGRATPPLRHYMDVVERVMNAHALPVQA